jgi:hypothetical protein
MFKEQSTEKLIQYIQTLPSEEQRLIAKRISEPEKSTGKKKAKSPGTLKLSSLKGKVEKTSSKKIDKQIKALRSTWQRNT